MLSKRMAILIMISVVAMTVHCGTGYTDCNGSDIELLVTNTNDSGPGSLRAHIANAPFAAHAACAPTIRFSESIRGQAINLTSGRLIVGKYQIDSEVSPAGMPGYLKIIGDSVQHTVIDGQYQSQIMYVASTGLEIENMVFQHAYHEHRQGQSGGAIVFLNELPIVAALDNKLAIDQLQPYYQAPSIIRNSEFIENEIVNSSGGAISTFVGLTLENVAFHANTASGPDGHGGALAVYAGYGENKVRIHGCSFDLNTSTNDGGAIYINSQLLVGLFNQNLGAVVGTEMIEILNSTIANNYAGRFGGGIGRRVCGLFDTLSLTHVTIVGNAAVGRDNPDLEMGGGGGLWTAGCASSGTNEAGQVVINWTGYPKRTIRVANSIIAGNTSVLGPDVWASNNQTNVEWHQDTEPVKMRDTLIYNVSGAHFENGSGQNNSWGVDPQMGSAIYYRAAQPHLFAYSLPQQSPAVNFVRNGYCADYSLGLVVTVDQLATPRPQLATCDAGSYEYQFGFELGGSAPGSVRQQDESSWTGNTKVSRH